MLFFAIGSYPPYMKTGILAAQRGDADCVAGVPHTNEQIKQKKISKKKWYTTSLSTMLYIIIYNYYI